MRLVNHCIGAGALCIVAISARADVTYTMQTPGNLMNSVEVVEGMADKGWSPVTLAGWKMDTPVAAKKAMVWRKHDSAPWMAQPLPDLGPGLASWAKDVEFLYMDATPTFVAVGAVKDVGDLAKPALWRYEGTGPWQLVPLPLLAGGEGEARDVTLKDFGGDLVIGAVGWASTGSSARTAVVWLDDGMGAGASVHPLPTYDPNKESWVNFGRVGFADLFDNGYPGVGAAEHPDGRIIAQLWDYNGVMWTRTEMPLLPGGTMAEGHIYLEDVATTIIGGWADNAQGDPQPVVWTFDGFEWNIVQLDVPIGAAGGKVFGGTITKGGGPELVGAAFDALDEFIAAIKWDTFFSCTVFYSQVPPASPVITEVATAVDQLGRVAGFGPIKPVAMQFVSLPDTAADSTGAYLLVPAPPTGVRETPPMTVITAYPSPFRSVVTVDIEGAGSSHRVVSVYDAAGRFVATLFDGSVAGRDRQTLRWNATDERGRDVPSGVYFVRFWSEGAVTSRKIVLTR